MRNSRQRTPTGAATGGSEACSEFIGSSVRAFGFATLATSIICRSTAEPLSAFTYFNGRPERLFIPIAHFPPKREEDNFGFIHHRDRERLRPDSYRYLLISAGSMRNSNSRLRPTMISSETCFVSGRTEKLRA